jgi:hypothetical protein
MVTPLTPKLTRKAKALAKAPPTIASRREEDASPLFIRIEKARATFVEDLTGNRKPETGSEWKKGETLPETGGFKTRDQMLCYHTKGSR